MICWWLVRILLAEQLPRELAPTLVGHEVRTVHQQGWDGLRNGELLSRAALDGFEIFVTADRSLQFQQNLARFSLAVMVLVAPNLKLESLLPLVPQLLQALPEAQLGQAVRIGVGS